MLRWQCVEAFVFEVPIQGERLLHALFLHELETHTIDEAQLPAIPCDEAGEAAAMERLGHPADGDDRKQSVDEIANGGEPEVVLQQRPLRTCPVR